MTSVALYLLLSAAVFSGALVSSLAGFAFSAAAGAILLHVFPPVEAVPLMMLCSIAVQVTTLLTLRQSMQWRGSLVLICGGVLGIPPAVYLLQNADISMFRVGFGVLVASYAAYMLFRPALNYLKQMEGQLRNALIGFGGGFIGGLTAMPGALPTIWCDLHGLPKNQQRGLVQPFIAVMQILALALMLARHSLSSKLWIDLAVSLPSLAAGTALGILIFRRVDDALFRRIILAILLFSGLALVV
jgi:uncharacterized membrane protein YfcA